MEAIIEYIMSNYTWFLGGAIIILLAIIGSYADKTNFGQGKNKIQEKDDKLNLQENNNFKTLQEAIDGTDENQIEENITDQQENKEMLSQESDLNLQNEPEVESAEMVSEEDQSFGENSEQTTFDSSFEEFDKKFNEILPKKEIIDDELLDEIENLSLDKTQKIDLNDIPELEDMELPKIKNLEPETEDIWKF